MIGTQINTYQNETVTITLEHYKKLEKAYDDIYYKMIKIIVKENEYTLKEVLREIKDTTVAYGSNHRVFDRKLKGYGFGEKELEKVKKDILKVYERGE